MNRTIRNSFLPSFTLIELLITVSLIALLAAFAVPTYELVLSQMQLNSAVDEVVNFVRTAQQRTITEQKAYGVTLTVGAVTVPLFLDISGTLQNVDSLALPTSIVIDSVSFSGHSNIEFLRTGAPQYSGNFVLHDLDRNRYRTVIIRPAGNVYSDDTDH